MSLLCFNRGKFGCDVASVVAAVIVVSSGCDLSSVIWVVFIDDDGFSEVSVTVVVIVVCLYLKFREKLVVIQLSSEL